MQLRRMSCCLLGHTTVIILGKELVQDYGNRAYINEDETIDVSDVNELVNIILGK